MFDKDAPYGYDTNGAKHTAETLAMALEDKGNEKYHSMSTRDIVIDMHKTMARTEELVTAFLEDMKSNPMMKMFGGRR